MGKSELTLEIENQAMKQFSKMGVFMCPECSFQRAWIKDKPANVSLQEFHTNPRFTQIIGKHVRTEIVDILELNSQKDWVCYEIKISKSDFHSEAIKSFVGNYNYYLMTEELYNKVKNEIPKEIGVYTYKNKYLTLVKKSRKQKLIEGMDGELNYGMIRALNREREKQRIKIKSIYYSDLQNYIYKLQNERKEKRSKLWNLKHYEIGKQKEINDLEVELDVLDDVSKNLIDIIR